MDPEVRSMWKQSLRYMSVGLEMGLSVAIGLFLGIKGDEYLGTEPVLMWVGLSLGFGSAAKAIVDAARRAKKEMDKDDTDSPEKS